MSQCWRDMSMIVHMLSDSRRSSSMRIYQMWRMSYTSMTDVRRSCETRWCHLFEYSGLDMVSRSRHGSLWKKWWKSTPTCSSRLQLVVFDYSVYCVLSLPPYLNFEEGEILIKMGSCKTLAVGSKFWLALIRFWLVLCLVRLFVLSLRGSIGLCCRIWIVYIMACMGWQMECGENNPCYQFCQIHMC